MTVNNQTLRGIFVGFNTSFNMAFAEANPLYAQVATIINSTAAEENYPWLGSMPGMREWIGERELKNLQAYDYSIKNKSFESTVSVKRNDIEDDKIGTYAPSIQMLGQGAALHPDVLVFELMANGFELQGYDKVPFFSTKHKVGKKEVSNKGTAKLSQEAYIAARAAIMSFTDEEGKALKCTPDLLVVPPALEGKAREILMADVINGTTNIMKDTAKLLVVPDLAGNDNAWYLLSTTRPLKPFIYQKRQEAKFVSITNETSDNVFMRNEYIYGVDSRGNAGYGFWQMAYGSDGTKA